MEQTEEKFLRENAPRLCGRLLYLTMSFAAGAVICALLCAAGPIWLVPAIPAAAAAVYTGRQYAAAKKAWQAAENGSFRETSACTVKTVQRLSPAERYAAREKVRICHGAGGSGRSELPARRR